MDDILLETEEKMEEVIGSLEHRLTKIRAGRANPTMLDGITIDYYGADTPLNQIANISTPEARMLQIKPFDKSLLGDIEKAIFTANIGITPNNNGDIVFLNIPALTEDTRKDYVKQAKGFAEDAKIILRNIRQDANNNLKKTEESDDAIKGATNNIQDLINKFNKTVDDVLKIKENELMTL